MGKYSRYLLEKIASMYYVENMSQDEISTNLCISRSNVSRLLKRAREEKVFEVNINYTNKKKKNYTGSCYSKFSSFLSGNKRACHKSSSKLFR
jgi:DNA-binding transcriptional regulator LsrR (DeoR family)